MLSDTNESNAQRNKLGLQATTSSALSNYRHTKRRKVVMQSKKPPSPLEFQVAACSMVWIFSGITQSLNHIKHTVDHK